MNLSTLLGRKLKDDAILGVLERCGIEKVVYDFDRLHEGTPDVYWASSQTRGFSLRFDAAQTCDVVFCYVVPAEGFAAVDPSWVGVAIFASYDEAEQRCREGGLSFSVAGLAMAGRWLLVDAGATKIHYEFRGGELALITLFAEPSVDEEEVQ